MSTIGQLLAMAADPGIKPWDEIVQSSTQTKTGLMNLAELKAKQQAEQDVLERIKNDPEVARQLFGGGPVLGSLMQPQTAPGAGPMTQQTVMPGQPPGAPQTVPGGQDLSQFATQGAPQSTIASLGPAGQPQPQAPRNPLLEMARTDPRAAMMLQQQMQGQQDRQWKIQEQQLSNGVKVAEYVSRMLQGVTNQETLDQAREQIRLVHPQAASQVPQMYSKESVAAVQQKGATITEMAQNRYHEAKARNLDMETQMFPELAKRFGLGDDVQAPAGGGASTTTAVPTTGQQAPGTAPVPGLDKLSQPFRTKADSIADRLGANREDLYRVMHFETGGEMSPATTNRAGSGATGLIQFTPDTAKRLGTTTEALAKMTPEQQLDYVEKYLEPHKGNIGTLKDLYMAVLYPAAIGKSEDTVLFSPDKTPAAYRQNAGLDAGNKGYVTVGDAVAAVERSTGAGGSRAAGGTTGTAQADPRIAQYDAKIAQRTRDAQIASLMKNESLSTRLNDDANRLTAEKNRLLDESRRQQERAEETPRALDRERQLTEQKQELERKRQAGPLLPEDRRKLFTGLRTDIRAEPTFKVYQDVRNGYQNVKVGAASDSAQGDLAIFNGLAKILDPTSSVMSGEARNIEEAQGQLQLWFNSPQKFLEGDRISKENRPRFLKMAYDLAKEKLTTAQTELRAVYGGLAKEGNIDFDQLVPLADLKPLEPGPNVSKLDELIKK